MDSIIDVLVFEQPLDLDDSFSHPSVDEDEPWERLRGNTDPSGDEANIIGGKLARFSEAALRETLKPMVSSLSNIFNSLDEIKGMNLRSIDVGLEISAEGGFVLIGSGKLGSKGAIKLTFEIPTSKSATNA